MAEGKVFHLGPVEVDEFNTDISIGWTEHVDTGTNTEQRNSGLSEPKRRNYRLIAACLGLLTALLVIVILAISLAYICGERDQARSEIPTCSSSLTKDWVPKKSFLFLKKSDNSYVKLLPKRSMVLTSFTLCLRVATELQLEQDIILFEYRTRQVDELTLWREKDGNFSCYINGKFILVPLPQMSTFQTHLCVTWESRSGLTTFYMDGRRSTPRLLEKGYTLLGGGDVFLGQDVDNIDDFLHKRFDVEQSFVGEISDINMWDYVLPQRMIEDLHCGKYVPTGNIFDWDNIAYEVEGEVLVI